MTIARVSLAKREMQLIDKDVHKPNTARSLTIVLSILLGGMLVWGSIATFPEMIRATGRIEPAGALRRVDHLDGGAVLWIGAERGDTVQKGQVIAKVGQPDLQASRDEIQRRLSEVELELGRYRAFLSVLETGVPPVSDALGPHLEGQYRLHLAQERAMQERIERMESNANVVRRVRDNIAEEVSLTAVQLKRVETLFNAGHVSTAQWDAEQRDMSAARSRLLNADLELESERGAIGEVQDAGKERVLARQENTLARIHELDLERQALLSQRDDYDQRLDRLAIHAPEDGVIQSSVITTIGQVVQPGAVVFELLPAHDRLVAVVRLSPNDIGHVSQGHETTIKFTTFDFRRFGHLTGIVETIAPTTEIDEAGQPYYRTIVKLDADSLSDGRADHPLRAGMEVWAEIVTRERTLVAYFLKPLERSLQGVLGER